MTIAEPVTRIFVKELSRFCETDQDAGISASEDVF
jgi:hypothetical protein